MPRTEMGMPMTLARYFAMVLSRRISVILRGAFVYSNLIEGGATQKPVPCAYNDDQFYWYEGVTDQRLSDYMYWKSDYDTFKKNLEENCEYVSVMSDSRIYLDNQEYFDSMERVFENEIGFVARVNKD